MAITVVGQASLGVETDSTIFGLTGRPVTEMVVAHNHANVEIGQSLSVLAEVTFDGAQVTFGGDDVIW